MQLQKAGFSTQTRCGSCDGGCRERSHPRSAQNKLLGAALPPLPFASCSPAFPRGMRAQTQRYARSWQRGSAAAFPASPSPANTGAPAFTCPKTSCSAPGRAGVPVGLRAVCRDGASLPCANQLCAAVPTVPPRLLAGGASRMCWGCSIVPGAVAHPVHVLVCFAKR